MRALNSLGVINWCHYLFELDELVPQLNQVFPVVGEEYESR